jgi:uncharacterized protein
MVAEEIKQSVKKYLGALKAGGLVVPFGVVFGSHANGCVGKWSDVDLLIVSRRFDQDYGYDEVEMLWQAATKTDSRIEPVPCGLKEWEGESDSPIIEIAKKEGEKITE